MKKKAHILTQREEELLAGAGEIFGAAGETFAILDNADIVFPMVHDEDGNEVQLSHGNYITLVESKNREVRKEAYEALYSIPMLRLCRPMSRSITTMRKSASSHLPVKRLCQRTSFQKVFMTA